jgi:hypothetical protein
VVVMSAYDGYAARFLDKIKELPEQRDRVGAL